MAARPAPGESITNRLMSRAEGGGLDRRRMADGGEVFTGSVARKALRTLGARAFTVDNSIVVDPSFDPRNPKDAALYAHERHHRDNSGGEGGGASGHNDHEESKARTIEAMVLHRMEAGEDMASVLHDVTTGTGATVAKSELMQGDLGQTMVGRAIEGDDKDRNSMEAYWHQRSQGQSHRAIVDEISRHSHHQITRQNEEYSHRSGNEVDLLGHPLNGG